MTNSKEHIISGLRQLLQESKQIQATAHNTGSFGEIIEVDSSYYNAWRIKLLTFLRGTKIEIPDIVSRIEAATKTYDYVFYEVVKQIESLIDLLEKDLLSIPEKEQANWNDELENIFKKFHKVARQLRTRYKDRDTLNISDEYDVQDLLHALLQLHFDDIRAEEWTPSYAGGSVRVDFLLKDHQTFIEVKKSRQTMTEKELGEQLIVDCEKYKAHQDCKMLYCFVYDPEGYLGNPIGIKNDLEKAHEGFIKVFIIPE